MEAKTAKRRRRDGRRVAPAPGQVPASLAGDDARRRLLRAMAVAVSEKGYGATTVADVVRIARVSRRTFYEHFDDRESCFLALGDHLSEFFLDLVAETTSLELPWRDRVDRTLEAYLSVLAANPGLTRAFMLEPFGMGPHALARRRRVFRRGAEQLVEIFEAGRRQNPELNPVSFDTATAIIGGIYELVLLAAEEGRAHELDQLRDTATQLISDVLTAPRTK
jgi:AcrR family transcriptional regulator